MDYSRTEKSDLWLRLLLDGTFKDEVEEFKSLDTSGVTFSKAYYRRRRRIVSGVYWKSLLASIRTTAMKAAMVFLVVLSLGFVTVMAIPSLRQATIETVKSWFDDHVEITFEENGDYVQFEIVEPNKPTGLPEDVEEEIIRDDKTAHIVDYYIGDYWFGSFRQYVKSGNLSLDTEDAYVYDIIIRNKNITIFDRDKKGLIAYWEDESFAYTVFSDTMDDLMTLILSIK